MLGYFAWQAERGARGLAYNESLIAQVKKLSSELETASNNQKKLEDRVAELRPDAIDPDILDEMARKSLNYGLSGEVVVYF